MQVITNTYWLASTVAQKTAPIFAYFVKTYILFDADMIEKSD